MERTVRYIFKLSGEFTLTAIHTELYFISVYILKFYLNSVIEI